MIEVAQSEPTMRLGWRTAALTARRAESSSAATLTFAVEGWRGHRPGQHVDVRLTAEDGYQAQRSYSIATAPEDGELALTVERIDAGEVSPYLVEEMQRGDMLELRGPIGGWFVWEVEQGGPLMLIAGGSGLVPLMAMLRHRVARRSPLPARLILSARAARNVLYARELGDMAAADDGFELFTTLTRETPPEWRGFDRRVDRELLEQVAWSASERPRVYACGPTGFVEAAAGALVELGHDPMVMKTERFGPSGGAGG